MFIIKNNIEICYKCAKHVLGTYEDYKEGNSYLDFLFLARKKINEIIIDKNTIKIKDREVPLNDFKLYLNSQINLNDKSIAFADTPLLVLLISSAISLILSVMAKFDVEYINLILNMFLGVSIFSCILIASLGISKSIRYNNTAFRNDFFKSILSIVEEEIVIKFPEDTKK